MMMQGGTPPDSLFLQGMIILFILLIPMFAIYWIRQALVPKRVIAPKPQAVVYKFIRKIKKMCPDHAAKFHKKGCCLLTDSSQCDYCIKIKKS